MEKKLFTDEMIRNLPLYTIKDFMEKYGVGRTSVLRVRSEIGLHNKGVFQRNSHIFDGGIEKKLCCKCHTYKRLNEFGFCSKSYDKFDWDCLDCQRTRNKIRNTTEQTKKYQRDYKRNRRKSNPHIRIVNNIRRGITRFLKNRPIGYVKSKYTDYLGCDIQSFVKHIESQFVDGMTWENYGKVWHVDHIIPVVSFSIENIKLAWNYKNLRPMFAVDNFKKSDLLPNGKHARYAKK